MTKKTRLTASSNDLSLDAIPEMTTLEFTKVGKYELRHYTAPSIHWMVNCEGVRVCIEPVSPSARDRGRYVVKAASMDWRHSIDESDCFPRYYFDWKRMLLELEAWFAQRDIKKRPDLRAHEQDMEL